MKILTIAEQKENQLSNISFESIGAAQSLGGEVCCAILGGDTTAAAASLQAKGVNVFAFVHADLTNMQEESYGRLLKQLIDREKPDVVIGSASFYGKSLMARLAGLCGGGMASDCTALSIEEGKLTAVRPTYGGNVFIKVQTAGDGPFFITIRPKAFPEAADAEGGELVSETVDDAVLTCQAKVTERSTGAGGAVSLTEADIVVAGGRGIRAAENFKLIEEMAEALGGAVGSSRAIVDAGWVPYATQVGQTGKTVNPKLYIAAGISGAVQHLVGMRSSKTIVAINRDPDAPIFNLANYGIVGDFLEIAPVLTAKFKEVMK